MRFKSWPLYGDWCEIFGKDRATSENTQGFADVVNEVLHPQQPNMGNEGPPTPVSGSPTIECKTNIRKHLESSLTARKGKHKKIFANDPFEERVYQLIKGFCEKIDTHLGVLAQCIGYQQDAKKQQKYVFDALSTMSFLAVEKKLALAKNLCINGDDAILFFSPYEENKAIMVKMLLY
ncbi:hypothetical protein PHJA_000864900 [Phtheirospermum japonicum]|uniref:Uncharacterized protein n=1 Tax=Phtheirospermum japonicum TaxID=374723 RepID=A0A830BM11_9LAMI|nr:hypothetical protein PHJA_000864900 [Phtheirospermum japonicum]